MRQRMIPLLAPDTKSKRNSEAYSQTASRGLAVLNSPQLNKGTAFTAEERGALGPWVLAVAKNRAIDVIRRDGRFRALPARLEVGPTVDAALSPEADAENQLAMMFAICDDGLSVETHVTLTLRLLCGLSPAEIARAFLVDVQTIDRRLHPRLTGMLALLRFCMNRRSNRLLFRP